MLIIGCDFHTRYQQIAMAREETGELLVERRLDHESGEAHAFYRSLQEAGRVELAGLALGPWSSRRREEVLKLLDQLEAPIAELDRAVLEEAQRREDTVRLMTHPGIGPVNALAFVLAIGPVTRFRRSKKIASYLGLNPSEESSGGRRRLGAISKQGNTMVRWLLIEAVHHAVRGDSALRQDQ